MRHRAFTLVELLVVISIIALLAAISFPLFSRIRERAKSIACRANIHELLVSLTVYDNQHQSLPNGFELKEKVKPPGGYLGSSSWDTPGWWWFHFAGVIRDKSRAGTKLLQCPSKRLDDPALNADPLCGNYGANRALCKVPLTSSRGLYRDDFAGAPLSITSLKQPGSTLLISDSGYSLICWWNATADPPYSLDPGYIEDTSYVPGLEINKDKILKTGQAADAIGGRHPNKTINVGFADGHADPKPANDLLVEKTEDGRYTNTRLWLGQ
ncbi:MAG: type II secretion system protein [Phycisphaerae bacterium]|nr:type II secretion system protein [Phycisphaerae bacterium]